MTSAESPAVARRRVRLALRAARDAKRLTQGQVAWAMEWSVSKLMRIESGEVTISATDLRALLAHLEITDQTIVRELVNDAKVSRHRHSWWFDQRYRGHLPDGLQRLIQFETEAKAIRMFNIVVVPGLLQTPRYAAAILRDYVGQQLTESDVEVRHEVRMRRQQEFFARDDRPKLMVVLDESILHREVSEPDVLAEQFDALLRRAGANQVMIRVVPFTAGAPFVLTGAFSILDLEDGRGSLLYRENFTDDEVVEDLERVSRHRIAFERLWSCALGQEESIFVIERRTQAFSAGRVRDQWNEAGAERSAAIPLGRPVGAP
ncbi:MAG: helix-turn-helix domain-containing protein [Dactylosporangium sp.]|nr:helix-turn-helix domain-containing protein [Dactylosporangium sp.]NNJ62987.1 helix-turn-helix domain-containing protein [Dactylosporangium sp.]